MKLIKLNPEHYIIVDDSEIKEGDYKYSPMDDINKIHQQIGEYYDAHEFKITHSTQPLEFEDVKVFDKEWEEGYFDKIQPLNLSEVKELIGEVDVEKKAWKYNPVKKLDCEFIRAAYIKGYSQSLEDNKDNKYTNEDMLTIRNQLVSMLPVGNVTSWDMIQAVSKYTKWFDEYIQSLQPKTEWEVEIVDGKLKLK